MLLLNLRACVYHNFITFRLMLPDFQGMKKTIYVAAMRTHIHTHTHEQMHEHNIGFERDFIPMVW